jgi:hypothetical protein
MSTASKHSFAERQARGLGRRPWLALHVRYPTAAATKSDTKGAVFRAAIAASVSPSIAVNGADQKWTGSDQIEPVRSEVAVMQTRIP